MEVNYRHCMQAASYDVTGDILQLNDAKYHFFKYIDMPGSLISISLPPHYLEKYFVLGAQLKFHDYEVSFPSTSASSSLFFIFQLC